MEPKILILINALNKIADSGKAGICPYGCDTPHIARKALKDYADATQMRAGWIATEES